MNDSGWVAFVGAGPADPGLLTVRARELLGAAGTVIPDAAVPRSVLAHCRADVTVLPAGDSALAVRIALAGGGAGGPVVRVIDGDPGSHDSFVIEAAACAQADLPFEVVPGVAPATAVPAYAGMPLGADVTVVDPRTADWVSLGRTRSTLVMAGAESLPDVAAALVMAGRPGTTPVAVITGGTTTEQRTVVATLRTAAAVAEPAVVVIGDVVRRRTTLSWHEAKPLFGWRVLLPRTVESLEPVAAALRPYGATATEVPTLVVGPSRSPAQVARGVDDLVTGRYGWVAFTSANAVRVVRDRFDERGLDARALAGVRIAAVGPRTLGALAEWGIRADLVPSGEQTSHGLLAEWPGFDPTLDPLDGVLLLRAEIATETLAAGMTELGWEVDHVTAFRVMRAPPPAAETREAIKTGGFDAVLFTSSSSVRNLVGLAGKPHGRTVVACIGPQTARAAEEHHLRVDVVAPEQTAESLVRELARFGAQRRVDALAAGRPVYLPRERRRRRAR